MDTNIAEALAFLDGVYATGVDVEDEYVAHLWRIRQRDNQYADTESIALAQRLAALPPATTPAGWPPFPVGEV